MIRVILLVFSIVPSMLAGCELDMDLIIQWRDEFIKAPDTPQKEPVYIQIMVDAYEKEAQQEQLGYTLIEYDPCGKPSPYPFNKPRSKNLAKIAAHAQKCKYYQVPNEQDIDEKAGSKLWRAEFDIPHCLETLLRKHFKAVEQNFVNFFKVEISPNRLKKAFTFVIDDKLACPYSGGQPFLACFKLDEKIVIHPKLVRAELIGLLELAGRMRVLKKDLQQRPRSFTTGDKNAIYGSVIDRINSFKHQFDFLFAHELTHAYFKPLSGEFFADCMASVYIRKTGRPSAFGVWDTLKKARNRKYIGNLSPQGLKAFKNRLKFLERLPADIDYQYCTRYWGKRI